MQNVKVLFNPSKIEGVVSKGITILEAARKFGIAIESPCGGTGKCGKDLVQIRRNRVLETVLACKTRIEADLEVSIPSHEKKTIKTVEGFYGKAVRIDNINPSTGKEVHNENGVCSTKVFVNGGLSFIEDGDTTAQSYGIALDIGTTTLVASLVDLNSGGILGSSSTLNPLVYYGHDVMSRIKYSSSQQDGLLRMHKDLISAVKLLIKLLSFETDVKLENIYQTVAAGNTTMQHIFLNKEIKGIGEYPYKAETLDVFTTTAKALGLDIAEYAPVTTFPCISAYVGGDIVSGLLAVRHEELERPALFIDIGTNGELALITEDKILSTSTAAGPCFEGMTISCGMRAGDGAIEHVTFEEELLLEVIGGGEPKGICGSGLLDVVSELIRVGLVNSRGRLQSPDSGNSITQDSRNQLTTPNSPLLQGGAEGGCKDTYAEKKSFFGYTIKYKKYLFEKEGKRNFRLSERVSISQEDIRQVQLAKAAIRAGIEILLSQSRITVKDLRTVIIAGAFGYHARKESLFRIGMLPEIKNANVLFIGNSSLEGAVKTLLNKDFIQQATRISRTAQVMELSQIPDFEHIYIREMRFKD
ncbi:MAG: DUF4445 domain-containing protein [Planctomycetota bacterium]|nr:DUF4445 domain-containing protein [Planctomycetota bacterium]